MAEIQGIKELCELGTVQITVCFLTLPCVSFSSLSTPEELPFVVCNFHLQEGHLMQFGFLKK